MKQLIYKILTITCFLLPVVVSHAQRERNYVYLVEATSAMNTPENLWKNTRRWLSREIKSLSAGKVTIIPFQDEPLKPITFDIQEIPDNQANGSLSKAGMSVTQLMKRDCHANLYAALKAAVKQIDNKKDNFIYILTNSAPTLEETEALGRFIQNWCNMKPDNVYVFYIMLTHHASNEAVKKAVSRCPDFFLIDAKGAKLKSICALMPRDIVENLQDIIEGGISYYNTPRLNIHSSIDGPFFLHVHSNDTLFQVPTSVRINEYGSIHAMPRSPNTIEELLVDKNEYCFDLQISADTSQFWLVTDRLHVRVINEPERILYLPASLHADMQIHHYPEFLFWKSNRPDTLHLYLEGIMNKEARKSNASSLFQITLSGLQNDDYKLFINNQECFDKTFTLDSSARETRLDIVFSSYVPIGLHQLVLRCLTSHQLDRINAIPPGNYYQSQLINYQQNHNPLAYLLIIFCLLLFAIPSVIFITKNAKNK